MKLSLKSVLKVKQPSLLAAVVCLIHFFSASPSFGAGLKQLHGHVPSILKNLAPIGSLPATNELRLAIGVPLRDPAGLDKFLAEVYDPASPNYRHFLTPEEFTARFSATAVDYAALKNFALANGFKITQEHGNRLLLDVRAKASDVERAFHIKLNIFKHPTEAREFFAPDSDPTVDADLPVADIQGLSDCYRPHPKLQKMDPKTIVSKNGSAPDDSGNYFGDDFRNAYAPGVTLTGAGQSVGLFQLDAFYPNDITKYAQMAGGGRTNIMVQAVLLDSVTGTPGYSGVAGANVEVSLDIEMTMAMAPGLSKIIVFEGSNPNTILNTMAASNMVKSLSCSWGWGGVFSTDNNGVTNVTEDAIFRNMAAQGQSFFDASGDSDAFVAGSGTYSADNNWPSSSPYITQVGGTTLTTAGIGASYASETVWNRGSGTGSSGGVSSYYPIPSWQTNISMTANLGSTSQRNIPDVAMTAESVYVLCNNGSSNTVGGTSCAAPLWAGFMALVNQQAAINGNSPAGFINPAIYAIGKGQNTNYPYTSCFHDTTTGNNYWSKSPANYPAVAGYDLCTGWGTPNGQNLINALAGPPVISSFTGVDAFGPVGGPFSPTATVFALTNSGAANLSWSLVNTSAWLNVSLTNGILSANTATNILFGLAATASQMPAGNYAANLLFTNSRALAVLNLPFQLQVGQSLVQNGGFETSGSWPWIVSDNGGPDTVVDHATISPHSGAYSFAFGQANSLASLSQTLSTIPGQSYLLSFWLSNPTSKSTEIFQASWNGTNVYAVTNPPVLNWTYLNFIVTATGTNTTLQFAARNDPFYFGLDDVSVLPIPTPSFTAFSENDNSFALTWNSLAGISYIIQYKTNLVQTNWINLATNTATAAVISYTNGSAADPARFYRIRRLP